MAFYRNPAVFILLILAVEGPCMVSYQRDCGKLTYAYRRQLKKWIGGGFHTFKLLYSAVRDGCSPSAFHQHSDFQGPTVTVVYQKNQRNDSVFGAYTSRNWTSGLNIFITDKAAFLFFLRYNGKNRHVLMPQTGNWSDFAIGDTPDYGPMFGGGRDLLTFSRYNCRRVSNYFSTNGFIHIGYTYNPEGLLPYRQEEMLSQFTELEVYKVETLGSEDECNRLTTPTSPPVSSKSTILKSTILSTSSTSTTLPTKISTLTTSSTSSTSTTLSAISTSTTLPTTSSTSTTPSTSSTSTTLSTSSTSTTSQTRSSTQATLSKSSKLTVATTKMSTPTTMNNGTVRCFSCLHLPHLRYCDTVQRCHSGQVCYTQRRQGAGDVVYFSAGCTSSQTCPSEGLAHKEVAGDCFSCCTTDFCNHVGCADEALPPLGDRGPLCFVCQNYDNPDECNTVNLCAPDELCSIRQYRWGKDEMIYKMGCETRHNCASVSGSGLREQREARPLCHKCCDRDYCNTNCTDSSNTLPIIG